MTDETPTAQPMTTAKVSEKVAKLLDDVLRHMHDLGATSFVHDHVRYMEVTEKKNIAGHALLDYILELEQRAANAERKAAALDRLETELRDGGHLHTYLFSWSGKARWSVSVLCGSKLCYHRGDEKTSLLAAIESLPAPAGDEAGVKDE